MKILFPVVDNDKNKEVLASGFFETKNVCVFDSDTLQCQHLNIDELGSSMRNLPMALKELNINSIISTKIRPLALQILMRCGLDIYKAKGTDVEENLGLFQGGFLTKYSIESSRELLACNGTCSSCSSTSCS